MARILIPVEYWKGTDTIELECPGLVPEAIQTLDYFVKPHHDILELGAGGSTIFFSRRCKSLTSIESQPEWADTVRNAIKEKGIQNVSLYTAKTLEEAAPYIQDKMFDVILVDCVVIDRVAATALALKVIKPEGLLVIDNYDEPYCQGIENLIKAFKQHNFDDCHWSGKGTKVVYISPALDAQPPADQSAVNRDRLIERTKALHKQVSSASGVVALNVGSSEKVLPGYINIDKYLDFPGVYKYDMCHLPYKEGTVDLVFSEHSLEHLPLRHVSVALVDWYRVLKKGGVLFLSMPDLDLVLKSLLEPNLSPEMRRWRLYTLFGYQIYMGTNDSERDPPVDPGQFHCSGHSLKTLTEELVKIGYTILDSYNYDGWGTPGLFVEAIR